MADVGNLRVVIGADTSGLERGRRRSQQELEHLNGSMQRAGQIATRLTGLLGAIGIGVGLSNSIRQIADFQGAMNGLAAVSGATAKQMQELENQARTLGATSMFSAQQAGEAQRFLAQAGFNVNEVMSATPGILKLATAGNLDLASAADIASNVLGGMRLEVGQLNRVNDVLAATSAGANTDIRQLGQALSFAAPFAASAGISIEQASAAIGAMSDAGIQASRAGTGLVGVIRQLSNVTPNSAGALAELGLSVADVNIETLGLQQVLENLAATSLNVEQAIKIFGSEAGAAAQILVNSSRRVGEFTEELNNAEGATDRMAYILGQGLGPAFKSLNSAISESILQMGDSGMAGTLELLVGRAAGVISVWNGMTDAFAEANNMTSEQVRNLKNTADFLRVVATIAAGATAAMVAYRGALAAATIAQVAFNVAVRANPLGLLATGVGAAAGALWSFRDELGLTSPAVKTSADVLAELSSRVNGASQEMLKFEVAGFNAELFSLRAAANQAEQSIASIQERIDDGGLSFEERGAAKGALERQIANLQRINSEIEGREQAIDSLQQRMALLSQMEIPDIPEIPGLGIGGEGGEDEAAERRDQELEQLREHLALRVEALRESLMQEAELETHRFQQRMEELAQARELEVITAEEFNQLKEDLAQQHEDKLAEITQRGADERAKIEKRHADTVMNMRDNVFNQSVRLLDMFAGESKVAALASIALEKGLAIAKTVMNTQVAQMRALAELGPIAGPPVAAKIGTMGAISTGLIAAQGLAQAGSALGGGGASSVSSSVGGSANQPNQPQQSSGSASNPVGGTLTVQGISSSALFTGDAVRELAEELLQYQKRGGRVLLQ